MSDLPEATTKLDRSFYTEEARARFDALRLQGVRLSREFQARLETHTRTRIEIEPEKIVVEKEETRSQEIIEREVVEALLNDVGGITQRVGVGELSLAEGLSQYGTIVASTNWTTAVLETEPGRDIAALVETLEAHGIELCPNEFAGDSAPADKLRRFGMAHVRVPPEVALIEQLGGLPSVRFVYDAERPIVLPEPADVDIAEDLGSCVDMILDATNLPRDFPARRGEGVALCIVDTGVDDDHPDLKDRVVGARDFSGEGHTRDGSGHGTHCAGAAAGSGVASEGSLAGVAPFANILSAKVLDSTGCGTTYSVVAGISWAVEQGADVISLSLGSAGAYTDGTSLDSRACEKAVEEGAVVVVAAGNEGPGAGTIGTPGDAPSALTIGAIDREKRLADFSSRGPTDRPDLTGQKPTIVAPGVNIVAARSKDSSLPSYGPAGAYTVLSGTSMATPHVAGASAALVGYQRKKKRGGKPNRRVISAISESADALRGHDPDEQGRGLVQVGRAAKRMTKGAASRRGVTVTDPGARSRAGLIPVLMVGLLVAALVWLTWRKASDLFESGSALLKPVVNTLESAPTPLSEAATEAREDLSAENAPVPPPEFSVAERLYADGDYGTARPLYEKLHRMLADESAWRPTVDLRVAQCMEGEGHLDAAFDAYGQASRIHGGNLDVWPASQGQVRIALHFQDQVTADRITAGALKAYPNHEALQAGLYLEYARFRLRIGEVKEARRMLRLVIETAPDSEASSIARGELGRLGDQ